MTALKGVTHCLIDTKASKLDETDKKVLGKEKISMLTISYINYYLTAIDPNASIAKYETS